MHYKEVTRKHLKPGQEIHGYKLGNRTCSGVYYVKQVCVAYVLVEKWKIGGMEEKLDPDAIFRVEMTEEEFREKWNEKAIGAIKNIKNPLHYDEIGCHEICNSWLSSDPWEFAYECDKRKLRVVGHSKEICAKRTMFCDRVLDVGVCVEDEDGDRFWCHFSSEDMETMKVRCRKYQEYRKKKGR